MSELAIQTQRLVKKFGSTVAVDRVSFEVEEGEIFGFLGPNGAGKSTTIRMLCTLTRPTGGSATVAGYDIMRDDGKVRENIGLVAEKLIMYNELTARENLKLFGKLYDIPSGSLDRRIDELLSRVHMEKWGDSQIGTFSTGMKQRINVIRAMVSDPKILFLDEPTLGLDPQSTAEIRDLIRRINREQGTTMILTTHMMVEADMLCDRIGIIDRGRIVALDTPRGLRRLVSGTDTTVMTFEIPNLSPGMLKKVASLEQVESAIQEDTTILKVHSRGDTAFDAIVDSIRAKKGRIRAVSSQEPTLEDVFLKLTGRKVRDEVSNRAEVNRRGHGGPGRGPHGRGGGSRIR